MNRRDIPPIGFDYETYSHRVMQDVYGLEVPYAHVESFSVDEFQKYVFRIAIKYAAGQQVRRLVHQNSRVEKVGEIPCKAIDIVKAIIVDFCPTLNFGWLKPKYKKVNCIITVNENAEYRNIYPLSQYLTDNDSVVFRSYLPFDQNFWLLAEPPSKTDLDQAREEAIAKRNKSRKQLAEMMILSQERRNY